ncbi:MAG: PD40 domain-containing protein [Saprospiraceae bacterium]|nr:PD40 domain-containing protein [Saprospiraceae bacterium]
MILSAQSFSKDFRKAMEFGKAEKYTAAVNLLAPWEHKIFQSEKKIFESALLFFHANQLEKAEKYFLKIIEHKKYLQTSLLKLAIIKQHQYKFRDAILYYKMYAKLFKTNDAEYKIALEQIQKCIRGIDLAKNKSIALVEPLSELINSEEDEYNAHPSISHPNTFYYSAIRPENKGGKRNVNGQLDNRNGKFRSDIYVFNPDSSGLIQKNWINQYINSNYEDVLSHIGTDGRTIVFLQTWDGEIGKLYVDTLSSNPYRFEFAAFSSPLKPEFGDHDFFIFQDTLLIFSSDRIGGYGGKDLYISFYRNEKWSESINLGSEINSPFDEIHPYLANDGRTLYYSHNGTNSIGGYDLFFIQWSPEANQWSPKNQLPIPINSPGDELYFRLLQDGITATFSSNRKRNNKGKMDLYQAIFKEELPEQYEAVNGSILSQIYSKNNVQNKLGSKKLYQSKKSDTEKSPSSKLKFSQIKYQNENYLEEANNLEIIQSIAKSLQENSALQLKFVVHTYENSNTETNLFYGIALGKKILKKLESEKIDPARIKIFAVGDSFPMDTLVQNPNNNPNKRIEIFSFSENNDISENNSSKYNSKFTGLKFSFLLGESSLLYKNGFINNKHFNFAILNKEQLKSSYYYGIYSEFAEADLERKQNKDLKNAQLVALFNGIPLEKNQIIHHVAEFPDLLFLLNEYVKD